MEHIRKRGGIWWVRYHSHGRWHDESSHSRDRREAQRLLQRREVAALNEMFDAVIAGEPQGQRPVIPTRPKCRTRRIEPNPVHTAALLSAVCAFVRRFVVLSTHQAVAVTLAGRAT